MGLELTHYTLVTRDQVLSNFLTSNPVKHDESDGLMLIRVESLKADYSVGWPIVQGAFRE